MNGCMYRTGLCHLGQQHLPQVWVLKALQCRPQAANGGHGILGSTSLHGLKHSQRQARKRSKGRELWEETTDVKRAKSHPPPSFQDNSRARTRAELECHENLFQGNSWVCAQIILKFYFWSFECWWQGGTLIASQSHTFSLTDSDTSFEQVHPIWQSFQPRPSKGARNKHSLHRLECEYARRRLRKSWNKNSHENPPQTWWTRRKSLVTGGLFLEEKHWSEKQKRSSAYLQPFVGQGPCRSISCKQAVLLLFFWALQWEMQVIFKRSGVRNLTSSFVFICTPWQRSLWMALVTRAAGNREFTPITKASPQSTIATY